MAASSLASSFTPPSRGDGQPLSGSSVNEAVLDQAAVQFATLTSGVDQALQMEGARLHQAENRIIANLGAHNETQARSYLAPHAGNASALDALDRISANEEFKALEPPTKLEFVRAIGRLDGRLVEVLVRDLDTSPEGVGFAARHAEVFAGALGRLDLTQKQREALIQNIIAEPFSLRTQNALLTSPGFLDLSTEQRGSVLNLLDGAPPEIIYPLSNALDAVTKQGTPVLLDVDTNGNTLLSHVDHLLRTELPSERLGKNVTRGMIVSNLLADCADPYSQHQGEDSCGSASIGKYLTMRNPAEYGRIVSGLLLDGETKTFTGADLSFVSDSLSQESLKHRTATSAIFQSALLERSNGFLTYSASESTSELLGIPLGGGMSPASHTALYRDVLGGGFDRVKHFPDDAAVFQEWNDRMAAEGRLPAFVHLSGHVALYAGFSEGRAIIVDSNDWSSLAGGETTKKYGMRVEDPERGIMSMDYTTFLDEVRSLRVPR